MMNRFNHFRENETLAIPYIEVALVMLGIGMISPNNAFILNNPLTKSSFCSRIDMSHTTNPMQKEE